MIEPTTYIWLLSMIKIVMLKLSIIIAWIKLHLI